MIRPGVLGGISMRIWMGRRGKNEDRGRVLKNGERERKPRIFEPVDLEQYLFSWHDETQIGIGNVREYISGPC